MYNEPFSERRLGMSERKKFTVRIKRKKEAERVHIPKFRNFDTAKDVVNFGRTVRVHYIEDDEICDVTVSSFWDAYDMAPICEKIMHKKVGDTVIWGDHKITILGVV